MADSLVSDDNQTSNEDRETIRTKWKDKPLEQLLDAKVESDLYINSLTARLDDLRKDYLELRDRHQAGTELKDLIDQLKQSRQSGEDTRPPQGENNPPLKLEDIESVVSQRVAEQINQQNLIQKQQQNFNIVQEKLREHFGDNYQDAYKQRLSTLGLTREFADDLAKNHPSVFMKTFELDTVRTPSAPSLPRSSQRQASFAPSTPKRDWNYYQEMKKTNPRMYLDPKIAIQMHDDAIALGDDFGMPKD